MRVITRQFTKEILVSTLFVLTALVAIFAFFELIGQLDDVSKDYPMSFALLMTVLVLPDRIYEVMPLAVLLAAVYTMSRWSASSEYTVLRVAGMSPARMALSLLLPGLLLVAATYGVGEFLSPWSERYAQEQQTLQRNATLRARGYASGVWVRDVTTNVRGEEVDRYINVSNLIAGESNATGAWRLFEFSPEGKLMRMIRADSAHFEEGKGWWLHDAVAVTYPDVDPRSTEPTDARIVTEPAEDFFLKSSLGPDILGVMTTKPADMSMRDLDRYLKHLERTNQQKEQYEIAFWSKVFYPLAILVMLALSMPFAYMNARAGGVAIKIFFGVMIGIVFYAMNNLFAYLGVLNTWSPLAASLAPTVVMLVAAACALYWVEKR